MNGGFGVLIFQDYRYCLWDWFLACFYSGGMDLVRELLLLGLIAAIAYQLKMVLAIYPYLENRFKKLKNQINVEQQISLLVANVLTPNDKYHLLLEQIDHLQPDVVLTLETDSDIGKRH